jgi:mono/diheme cytochrome c family protein
VTLEAIPHLEKQEMLGRALSLATVTLLIACFTAGSALAQVTNLEAGKSPSQIFAGTCSACHKSPRGLLKTVPASSLPAFLRQHYTTSSGMASVLSSFLVSNGASDTRYQAKDQPKDQQKQQAKDARQEAKPEGKPDQLDRFGRRLHPPAPVQEALTPDAEGRTPQGPGRDAKRLARPGQAPDAATDGRPGARQKLGKRGKPGAES